ncbi:hypothetical protein [Flavobacterium sp. CGRL2]
MKEILNQYKNANTQFLRTTKSAVIITGVLLLTACSAPKVSDKLTAAKLPENFDAKRKDSINNTSPFIPLKTETFFKDPKLEQLLKKSNRSKSGLFNYAGKDIDCQFAFKSGKISPSPFFRSSRRCFWNALWKIYNGWSW